MSSLSINNLTVCYGSFKALDDVSLSVPYDSITAFVGSNGAGKTTTFSAVAGFIKIKSGDIYINNTPFKEFKASGGMIGLLPQDVSFFEDRTVYSQMLFLGRLSGIPEGYLEKEVNDILDKTKLLERKENYPPQLSRGMKVRLGIAQALLGKPELIFLDEPAAGLDPVRKNEFYELINSLKGETSFLISSHQLSELETICDRVIMIDKGKIIKEDSMQSILSQGEELLYRVGDPEKLVPFLQQKLPDFDFSLHDNIIHIPVGGGYKNPQDVNALIIPLILEKGVKITEIKLNSSLQNRFIEYLGKHSN